jgi:hypothetical protein
MKLEMGKTWGWKSVLNLGGVMVLLLVLLSPSLSRGTTLLIVDGGSPPSACRPPSPMTLKGSGSPARAP